MSQLTAAQIAFYAPAHVAGRADRNPGPVKVPTPTTSRRPDTKAPFARALKRWICIHPSAHAAPDTLEQPCPAHAAAHLARQLARLPLSEGAIAVRAPLQKQASPRCRLTAARPDFLTQSGKKQEGPAQPRPGRGLQLSLGPGLSALGWRVGASVYRRPLRPPSSSLKGRWVGVVYKAKLSRNPVRVFVGHLKRLFFFLSLLLLLLFFYRRHHFHRSHRFQSIA